MTSAMTTEVLNRVYVIHNRSFPAYLHYAKPNAVRGDEEAKELLDQIASSQHEMRDRLAAAILENGGDVHPGEFPMDYTFYHDLSYEFIIHKVVEYQRRDIIILEQAASELNLAPMAKALVEESLGMAKGNLDSLLELTRQQSGAE